MKKLIVIIIAIVVLAGAFYMFSNNRKPAATSVKLGEAVVGDISSYLSTTATVKSKNSKEYYGLQSKITKVHVNVGSVVKKGDLLISYEAQDLATSIKQAEIQQDNAILQRNELINQNNEIKQKIEELDRQIKALKESGADVNSLTQQRNALQPISAERLKQAENSISLAKLSLDAAKQRLSESKDSIVAENSGVVTLLNAIEGSVSSSTQPVVIIQNIDDLKAVASVGKYDAGKIDIGQKVVVKGDKGTYDGKISFVDPVARRSTSPTGGETILGIEIDIIEAAAELKIDFDVDIDILLGEVKDTIKIPAESIRADKSGNYLVFVVANNRTEERQVVIGLQSDTEVQVLEGLKAGERVILNPGSAIKEGILVKEAQEGTK